MRYLEKIIDRVFIPGDPGTPAHPGHPGMPATDAYYAMEQAGNLHSHVTVITPYEHTFAFSSNGSVDIVPMAGYPLTQEQRGLIESFVLMTVWHDPQGNQWHVVHMAGAPVYRMVEYPAQPATDPIPPSEAVPPTESEWLEDMNFGWNAAANSISRLNGDLFTQFRVGTVIDAAVGFASARKGEHFRDIDFCMRFSNGQLRIYEYGERVLDAQSYDPAASYRLVRTGGRIAYYQGNERLRLSDKISTGFLNVVSALYAGGDRVI